jgi:arsenate reductase (glutaredoxin)
MAVLRLYTYANCDTCRKATRWLRDHDVAFEERAIRETPPPRTELRAMLEANGGELRRLFNTAGRDYRAQKLGEKLGTLNESAAFDLLTSNGNLVKRPFLIGEGVALIGFDPTAWGEKLASSPDR